MESVDRLQEGWFRARRHRRFLVASAATCFTGVLLLGSIGLIRWRGRQAVHTDTAAVLDQAGEQLLRTLQSRRGTLTLLRDVLARQSDLTTPQRQALGISAVKHTRHLLGIGLVQNQQGPVWWSPPPFSPQERTRLQRAVERYTQQRSVWQVPSTFTVTASEEHTLLVMLEPIRERSGTRQALIGAFDLIPLLRDFFAAALSSPAPVQVLEGTTVLYRSPHWPSTPPSSDSFTITSPIALDAARWTLAMQPSRTRVVETLSWFRRLLILLSIMAAVGTMAVVWMLTARTWILQRAVARRTAALRRTSRRLRQLATTDELTGLWNRRFFLDRWERECERAKRYHRPLACLMIDVNHFKRVNDQLGHAAGDLVLQRVAQELRAVLRHADVLARFGGDEFVIALPETPMAQAERVAEKLRRVSLVVATAAQERVPPVTISMGISGFEAGVREHPHAILEAADQALYHSKRHLPAEFSHEAPSSLR